MPTLNLPKNTPVSAPSAQMVPQNSSGGGTSTGGAFGTLLNNLYNFGSSIYKQVNNASNGQIGNVLGASTSAPYGAQNQAPAGSPPGGGGNAGGGGVGQGALVPQPSGPNLNYDISGPMSGLQAQEQALNSGYNAQISGIDTQLQQAKNEQNQFMQSKENSAAQQNQLQQQGAESAINQARRSYSEINQGLQALYGGSTGTGAFASQVAGSQVEKNIGDTQQNLANIQQQIYGKLDEIKTAGFNALQNYEQQANTAKQIARAGLDQAIAQIRSSEGMLQGQKADALFKEMSHYQDIVQQTNILNAQYQQQVQLQMQQANNYLSALHDRYVGQTFTGYNAQYPRTPNTPVEGATGGNALTGQPAQGILPFSQQKPLFGTSNTVS